MGAWALKARWRQCQTAEFCSPAATLACCLSLSVSLSTSVKSLALLQDDKVIVKDIQFELQFTKVGTGEWVQRRHCHAHLIRSVKTHQTELVPQKSLSTGVLATGNLARGTDGVKFCPVGVSKPLSQCPFPVLLWLILSHCRPVITHKGWSLPPTYELGNVERPSWNTWALFKRY